MNYKSITSIVMAGVIATSSVLSPVATFAKEKTNNNGNNGNHYGQIKKSLSLSLRSMFQKHNNRNDQDEDNDRDSKPPKVNRDDNNTNKPPVISSIKSPTVLKVGQEGTWTIKASDPENGSLEYSVDWGDNRDMKSLSKMSSSLIYTQTSTFTHTYSKAGEHTVKFTVMDDQGKTTSSSVTVRVVEGKVVTPIAISNLFATSTKPTKAVITWNTNVDGNSTVWYSTVSPVNPSSASTTVKNGQTKNHKINLDKLTPNTTYYVIVGSMSNKYGVGNATSSQVSFTTPAKTVATTSPSITTLSNLNYTALATSSGIGFNFTWNTDVNADSQIYYSTSSPVIVGGANVASSTDANLVTSHNLTINNLATSTTYYFLIRSANASSTGALSEFSTSTGSGI